MKTHYTTNCTTTYTSGTDNSTSIVEPTQRDVIFVLPRLVTGVLN